MLVIISGIIFLKYSYAGVSYQHLMRKHRKSHEKLSPALDYFTVPDVINCFVAVDTIPDVCPQKITQYVVRQKSAINCLEEYLKIEYIYTWKNNSKSLINGYLNEVNQHFFAQKLSDEKICRKIRKYFANPNTLVVSIYDYYYLLDSDCYETFILNEIYYYGDYWTYFSLF